MTTRAREVEALLEWLRRQAEHHEQMAAEAEATDHMSPLHFHGGMAIALADYASSLSALIAECETLRAALKPFADATAYEGEYTFITADFERAKAAYFATPPTPELITGEVGEEKP